MSSRRASRRCASTRVTSAPRRPRRACATGGRRVPPPESRRGQLEVVIASAAGSEQGEVALGGAGGEGEEGRVGPGAYRAHDAVAGHEPTGVIDAPRRRAVGA